MATIIQRVMQSSTTTGSDFSISDEEKAQLLAEIDKINKSNSEEK